MTKIRYVSDVPPFLPFKTRHECNKNKVYTVKRRCPILLGLKWWASVRCSDRIHLTVTTLWFFSQLNQTSWPNVASRIVRFPCWHWLVARQVWFTLHLSETKHCAWSIWGRLNTVLLVQAIKQYVLVESLCSNVQHTCSHKLYSQLCVQEMLSDLKILWTGESQTEIWSPRPPWLLKYDIICKVFDLTGQKCELYKRIKICFLSSPAACKWQDMWEATGHKIMRVSGSQRAPCTGLGQAWSLSSRNSQNILSYSLSFCLLILLPFCVFVLSS